jgi:hypothetical protein
MFRRKVMQRRRLFAHVLVVLFLLAGGRIHAQSTFGSIVGTVQDPSGAFISRAQVDVRNVEENRNQQVLTNDNGDFVLPNLKPGTYEVNAQASGFSRTSISNLRLEARQEKRVKIQLGVLAASQSVEVSANDTVTVNTENATISVSLTGVQVSELPANFRALTTSPLSIVAAAPGVQLDNGGKISVGGVLPTGVQFTVDGVSTDNVRHSGPLTNTYPSAESISEFRVSAVDNNAEFAEVGDVTFATKSGSNHFHGSAFEYLQNQALDATTLNAGSKPRKVANTFGGSIGGPIFLPHLYNGHDRTFFFVDYEGNRLHRDTAEQYWVPTNGERGGNLADLVGSTPLIDPFKSTVGNLVSYTDNTIPSGSISSVATKVLAYIPSPNASLANGNYVTNVATPIDTDGYDVRIDRILTGKQQIFGRWSWKNISSQTVNAFLPSDQVADSNRSLVLSHNYVFTPSLFNEFRFGLSYWNGDSHFPINGDTAVSSLGISGLDATTHPTSGGFPYIDFSSGDGFTQIGRNLDGATQSTTYQFADNFSWIVHRHSLKFGADSHLLGYHDVEHFSSGDDFGTFTFQQSGFTNSAFGDFLLGLPSNTYYVASGPNLVSQSTHFGFYAQDEFSLTHKLTVSVGLRWELHPPFTEANGNITTFDFAKDDVIVPDHTLAPSQGFLNSINLCPGGKYTSQYYDSSYPCTGFETASEAGLGQGLGTNYYANWDPRLGVAYRPFNDAKTVIRAGIGFFTAGGFGTRSGLLSGVHTANTQSFTNFSAQGVAPLYQFPDAYAGNGFGAIGSAMFMCGVNPHLRDPISAQWSLTVERELRQSTVVRASYIGMNSYRLENMEEAGKHGGH